MTFKVIGRHQYVSTGPKKGCGPVKQQLVERIARIRVFIGK